MRDRLEPVTRRYGLVLGVVFAVAAFSASGVAGRTAIRIIAP